MNRNVDSPALVVALTDYGPGPYAALLQSSVRFPNSPDLVWLDIDHSVALGNVRAGALTLRRTVPHFPPCVCVAVVDPGVGTQRRAIAVATASGHRFVGPDNGLLEPVVRRMGGAIAMVDLAGTALRATRATRTFDGRDLFGPVAGALAAGAALHDVGVQVDPSSLVGLAVPAPRLVRAGFEATALEVDHFGTIVLALDDQLAPIESQLGIGAEGRVLSPLGAGHELRVGQTFADVARGELVLYRDSDEALALARRDGSAAAFLHTAPGDSLRISFPTSDDQNGPEAA